MSGTVVEEVVAVGVELPPPELYSGLPSPPWSKEEDFGSEADESAT